MIKNEHLVYAYGERGDGKGQVLIIGLTDEAMAYLKATPGNALPITAPGRGFRNVTNVIVYQEKDKEALKARLRETGMVVSEAH